MRGKGVTSKISIMGTVLGMGFVLSGCLKRTKVNPVEGHDVKVTFIHTADWHSRLLPYSMEVGVTDQLLGLMTKSEGPTSVGGAARAAVIINRIRSLGGRVVHVDSGDVFQGAPVFNEFAGEVEFKVFSLLGVDAMVVGNHEYDMGVTNLVEKIRQYAKFPMINANYVLEDPNAPGTSELASVVHPYTIINSLGLRIGVIGLGSLSSIVSLYYGGNSLGATPLETVEIAQFWIDFLRPQVDVIVAVSHLGLRGEKKMTRGDEIDLEESCAEGNCNTNTCPFIERLVGDEQLIAYTSGIDIVFGGHLHIVLDPPEVIEDCNPDPLCLNSKYGARILEHLHDLGCFCHPEGHPKYDPDCVPHKRRVPLVHSGAFLKYIGQVDAVFRRPEKPAAPAVSCDDNPSTPECKQYRRAMIHHDLNGWELNAFRYNLHPVDERIQDSELDGRMQRLLEPYTISMYRHIQLGRYIAFAPQKIRRFSLGYGDSQLGDVVATSMQRRNRVEAQFALTNTLGIRADIEAGPITVEMMYNVFPFENTITTMTLSGREVIDLMDYVSLRSARRGCQAQAQVSGITTVMNCKDPTTSPFGERAQRITIGGSRLLDPDMYGFDENGPKCDFDGLYACTPADDPVCVDLARCSGELVGSCPSPQPAQPDPPCCNWRFETVKPCPAGQEPGDGVCCPLGELCTPVGCGAPVAPYVAYKAAVNDYIAAGGSGFTVLEFNTTQFNTGISLRDAVIDFLFTTFPACGLDPNHYQLCSEYLTQAMVYDCAAIQDDAGRQSCEAKAVDHAAVLCEDLPCITVKEDGRLEQVFPTN